MAKKGRVVTELSFNEDSLMGDDASGDGSPTTGGIQLTKEEMEEFQRISTPPHPAAIHCQAPPAASRKSIGLGPGMGMGLPGDETSMLKWSEVTVSGAHGKFALSQATSTPCRGDGNAPVLNLQSPDDMLFGSMTDEERERILQADRIKLFDGEGFEPGVGTALQRRLSLDPKQAVEQMQQQVGYLAPTVGRMGWGAVLPVCSPIKCMRRRVGTVRLSM